MSVRVGTKFVAGAGITPHIGENGNWYIGTKDTGIHAGGSGGVGGGTVGFIDDEEEISTEPVDVRDSDLLGGKYAASDIDNAVTYEEEEGIEEIEDADLLDADRLGGVYTKEGIDAIVAENVALKGQVSELSAGIDNLLIIKDIPYSMTISKNDGNGVKLNFVPPSGYSVIAITVIDFDENHWVYSIISYHSNDYYLYLHNPYTGSSFSVSGKVRFLLAKTVNTI